MKHRLLAVSAVSLAIALGLAPLAHAGALPDTKLRVKSVVLEPRTGAVDVTARTRCSGRGTMSWESSISQKGQRDRAFMKVPCDGKVRTQTLTLQPRNKRFHAGSAVFMVGDIICGKDACIGGATAQRTRLMPHRSAAV